MATDEHEHALSSYLVVAAAIAGNALVYVVAFGVLWAVAWVIRASIYLSAMAQRLTMREGV